MSIDQNVFHQHLDVCSQCRNNPFALCPEGARTLHQAVGDGQASSADVDLDRDQHFEDDED